MQNDSNKQSRLLRKVKHKHNLYLIESPRNPDFKLPAYARRAFVEVRPHDGSDRKVYLPLLGRHAIMAAMGDDADIFSYSYKPYVESEWLIGYYIGLKDQCSVDNIAKSIEECLRLAEVGELKEI